MNPSALPGQRSLPSETYLRPPKLSSIDVNDSGSHNEPPRLTSSTVGDRREHQFRRQNNVLNCESLTCNITSQETVHEKTRAETQKIHMPMENAEIFEKRRNMIDNKFDLEMEMVTTSVENDEARI